VVRWILDTAYFPNLSQSRNPIFNIHSNVYLSLLLTVHSLPSCKSQHAGLHNHNECRVSASLTRNPLPLVPKFYDLRSRPVSRQTSIRSFQSSGGDGAESDEEQTQASSPKAHTAAGSFGRTESVVTSVHDDEKNSKLGEGGKCTAAQETKPGHSPPPTDAQKERCTREESDTRPIGFNC
jgi:hypothetical protein